MILSVDFEKAFDTVSWIAMIKVLKAFNFGNQFIDYVMLCYRNFKVTIGNNGYFTKTLKIKRGNKQGCPLSALNFLLIIETIGLKLRQCSDIKPICVNGIQKLLLQYANDLWTATQFCQSSFLAQIDILQKFHRFSGLAINYNKTEIMRIGSLVGTDAKWYSRFPLIWSDGPIKILGVNFFPKTEETVQTNYQNKLEKVKNILKVWTNRSLTLIGKVQIVNTLALPHLLYCMQCLPSLSKKIISEYEIIIKEFIW